jgi:cell division protein FtsI (penicillin-binding protein 3)
MPGMDAIALLENLGVKVKAVGMGKVKTQSFKRVRI